MVQARVETMLAWFRERTAPWTERLPMRKEAATAAVSTECGFPNGAAELWTRGRERSGDSRSKHGVRLSEWRG